MLKTIFKSLSILAGVAICVYTAFLCIMLFCIRTKRYIPSDYLEDDLDNLD